MRNINPLKRVKCSVLSGLVVLVLSTHAFAATYYVNGSCGSSGNGTTATCGANGPWKTLAEASSAVTGGTHTINVAAGTYAETLTESHNGTNSSNFLHWLANGTVNINAIKITGNYVKVEGFTMNNTPYATNTGVIDISGSNWYVKGCRVTNSNMTGLFIWNASSHSGVFENNTLAGIADTGWVVTGTNHLFLNNDLSDVYKVHSGNDGDYVRFFGSGHTFRGNYFHNFIKSHMSAAHVDAFQTWNAVYSGSPQQAASNCIIERNYIFMGEDATGLIAQNWDMNNTITGFMIEGDGVSGTVNNLTIRNNIIEACKGYETGGPHSRYHVTNLRIYNNTFRSSINFSSGNNPAAIGIQGTNGYEIHNNITANFVNHHIGIGTYTTGGDIDYNLYWNSSGNVSHNNYTPAAHDISNQNPLFVGNYTNLQLQPGSPAIDAGATIPSVTDDYDGLPRPQGSYYDIGAYEYRTSTSSPQPPTGLKVIPLS
jgi:hypothetical protein